MQANRPKITKLKTFTKLINNNSVFTDNFLIRRASQKKYKREIISYNITSNGNIIFCNAI